MHLRRLIFTISLLLCLIPGAALARLSAPQFQQFDSILKQTPISGTPASPAPTAAAPHVLVPEPHATRVQVYFFKKSAVLWAQGLPPLSSLQSGAKPVSGARLFKDPQLAKLIQKYAQQHGVDPKLVQAMIRQESNFNPLAVSPKGAMGLMQLMPETAAFLGVEDPFDLDQNLKGGIRFLKLCLQRFNQNLPLALAAYNAGPGRIVEHQGMPPFKETHTFVKNIVQDYCGQAIDPAQVKLGPPPPEAPEPSKQPENASPALAAAAPPLNLNFFALPAPDPSEARPLAEKGAFRHHVR